MRIYETCGEINLENKTMKAYTFLPDLEDMDYKFERYFNISNDNEYGVFGVLTAKGDDYDLRVHSTGKRTLVSQPIDLEFINSNFATRTFEDIDEDSRIYFFCFHDDNFDMKLLSEIKDGEISLEEFLAYLRAQAYNEEKFPKLNFVQPKVGNGGILTVDGSC
ncbi:hypothetical protein [Flavobacterium koreense]